MSDVRRFEYDSFYGMVDKSDGDFVSYYDYDDLHRENKALQASLERLRVHADIAVTRLSFSENPYAHVLHRVVKQTPQQSLAEIKAEAVESIKFNGADAQALLESNGDGSFGSDDYEMALVDLHFISSVILANRAEQIRQQGGVDG